MKVEFSWNLVSKLCESFCEFIMTMLDKMSRLTQEWTSQNRYFDIKYLLIFKYNKKKVILIPVLTVLPLHSYQSRVKMNEKISIWNAAECWNAIFKLLTAKSLLILSIFMRSLCFLIILSFCFWQENARKLENKTVNSSFRSV